MRDTNTLPLPRRATLTSLEEAVGELVHDGDSVSLEGFTHLIPFAAGLEVLRALVGTPAPGTAAQASG